MKTGYKLDTDRVFTKKTYLCNEKKAPESNRISGAEYQTQY